MKLKALLFIIFTGITGGLLGQNTYQYTVDLTKVVDDKVFIELKSPKISTPEVTFYLPKIIPGTYAIADYGRFVSDIKAFDKKGKSLTITKVDTNSWKISGAKSLSKISYWIEDSFDTQQEGPEVFWPAGTNIEEGANYVINSSGFFGYFDGMKTIPFEPFDGWFDSEIERYLVAMEAYIIHHILTESELLNYLKDIDTAKRELYIRKEHPSWQFIDFNIELEKFKRGKE